MNLEDQIKAAAELDSYDYSTLQPFKGGAWCKQGERGFVFFEPEKYPVSYDAIIPLIQKQNYTVKARIVRILLPDVEWDCWGVTDRALLVELNKAMWESTPSQLLEALLRATNKWYD